MTEEKTISWEEVKELADDYRKMLETESHHDHPIIRDKNGTVRWMETPKVRKLVDEVGLNEIVMLFRSLGYDQNSEIYRKMYRDIGMSLSGYYDVFYWEVNNEKAEEYEPNKY